MRKVLITGAGGFIGSHLTELCVKQGVKVRAMVHYNAKNHWGWLEDSPVKNKIEVVCGDVRDYDFVFNQLKGCDTVFHLAALIGIPYSYISPMAYIKTNVEGTYNVLQAGKDRGTKNLVLTSTSETYGSAQYVPIDEKHPANAQSPYAATKVAADQLALSFHRSFGLPVKIVRPFNTYGPRQSARAIIPTVITQILNGKNTLHLGNLGPSRDLTFVEDTAKGFWAAAKAPCAGEVLNLGMNEEITVAELSRLIAGLMQTKIRIRQERVRVRASSSEVSRLRCDNRKMRSLTGWKPQFSLEQGLRKTIEWFKKPGTLSLYKAELYNV